MTEMCFHFLLTFLLAVDKIWICRELLYRYNQRFKNSLYTSFDSLDIPCILI